MVDDPIRKVGGEDLANLGISNNKADRTFWPISMVFELFSEIKQIGFEVKFEFEGIDSGSFSFAARPVGMEKFGKGEDGWGSSLSLSLSLSEVRHGVSLNSYCLICSGLKGCL